MTLIITIFIFYMLLSVLLMLRFFNINLMKYSFLIFSSISFYSLIEYSAIYITIILKMSLGLSKVSSIVSPGIFVTICFLIIPMLSK